MRSTQSEKEEKVAPSTLTLAPALSDTISYLDAQSFYHFAGVSTDRGLGSLE
jgi:hypothetical protein